MVIRMKTTFNTEGPEPARLEREGTRQEHAMTDRGETASAKARLIVVR